MARIFVLMIIKLIISVVFKTCLAIFLIVVCWVVKDLKLLIRDFIHLKETSSRVHGVLFVPVQLLILGLVLFIKS